MIATIRINGDEADRHLNFNPPKCSCSSQQMLHYVSLVVNIRYTSCSCHKINFTGDYNKSSLKAVEVCSFIYFSHTNTTSVIWPTDVTVSHCVQGFKIFKHSPHTDSVLYPTDQ